MTLDQLKLEASQHCQTCPRQSRLRESSVHCDGVFVSFTTGICPRNLWDHSAPIEPPPAATELYALCPDRIREEWSREWQAKIRAAIVGRVGRAVLIPRVFYEEALKNRK